ncbi:N-oxide-forming dimethylaniline monooxygenase [Morchella conica CCBAS932]|uniref:Flavin-containing monooxygenase 1 n=1 Tax=Morchella conica CCBAS932 TaxID=1392247 RepID=A0A3N4KRL0_9PEZI|nr:N-oxide-forming dimethylaniline monooxygenase [Morchella conica CCBAS932]
MTIRAAIIGAGISGLVSTKQCLEDNIEPVCFEAQGHIGGQWRYTEPDPQTGEVVSSIYRSIVINTSTNVMNMSDFPMDPKIYPTFPHHRHVQKYFEAYAEFFGLYPFIRFRHRVLSITPIHDNKWLVQTRQDDGIITEEVFDAVFVCTGHHSTPNIPDWEGVEDFKMNGGELIHSHSYRDPAPYIGENVAVVGIGNSGVDISSDLSTIANDLHLITRSGAWVFPRLICGQAYETLIRRAFMAILPRFFAALFLQFVFTVTLGSIPPALKPKHDILQAHPTIRSDLFERIRTGTIKPHRAEISRFTDRGIELTNGERIEPLSKVVACTGYKVTFPFLADEIYMSQNDTTNWVNLHRMVTPPKYPTLFFIGLVQPLGAIMPTSELQSRWATSVIHGEISLPPAEEMQKLADQYKDNLKKRYVASARHTIQVDYLPYMDSLSNDLGTGITPWRFIKTFGLIKGFNVMKAVYLGMPGSAQFRLFGKGAKPELARLGSERIYMGQDVVMSEQEKEELEKFRKVKAKVIGI